MRAQPAPATLARRRSRSARTAGSRRERGRSRAPSSVPGIDLGSSPLVVSPRTVVVSLLVGVLVTLAAAYVPARRAARVPPVAAMREDVAMAPKGLRLWGVVGVLLSLVGAGVLAGGLLASGAAAATGVLAAVWPDRRTARLDVLRAITTQ